MTLPVALALLASALQMQPAPSGSIEGMVRDEKNGRAVGGAVVRVVELSRSGITNANGAFVLDTVAAGRWTVRVTANGFVTQDVIVQVTTAAMRLDVQLERVQPLPRVSILASSDALAEAGHARSVFEGAVLPALTTLGQREMRGIPTVLEPDVMRSLQSMNGGVVLNDLNAQLYVRGGAPDQNQVLLDGAPVFGAYHLFGMAGAFNPDAVRRVDFYRGQQSARHGGALSSVIDVEQRDGSTPFVEGGISMLGARLAGGGLALDDRLTWMLAARRTHVDAVMGSDMPVAYRDGHLRLGFAPNSAQRIVLSGFMSSDRFAFDPDDPTTLQSGWSNAVGSLRWTRSTGAWRWGSTAWASNYRAFMQMGGNSRTSRTDDDVLSVGGRFDAERMVGRGTASIGVEAHRLAMTLDGADLEGGYFTGSHARTRVAVSAHGEWDREIGRVRLAPAVRVTRLGRSVLVEPRLSARVSLTNALSLTVGASRTNQDMSTLRDERAVLPGPAMWFLHPERAPVSHADAWTAELELWQGKTWQLTVGGYYKWMTDMASWRPVGIRDLSGISFDDGLAMGIEAGVRRHGTRLSGWMGYTLSKAEFEDATLMGPSYHAPWDRRHTLNGSLVWRVWDRLHLSAQGHAASGQPLWPFLGSVMAPMFEPLFASMETTRLVPLWMRGQMRNAWYARADVGARTSFTVLGTRVEPYLNLQNVSRRPNVLYYEVTGRARPDGSAAPMFRPMTLTTYVVPSFGFNLSF